MDTESKKDAVYRFLRDITRAMSECAHMNIDSGREAGRKFSPNSDYNPSRQKMYYGDKWSLLYGVRDGWEMYHHDPTDWHESYSEYGSGAFGDGLELGRSLCVYDPNTSFEFTTYTEPTESEQSNDTEQSGEFQFTDYNNG